MAIVSIQEAYRDQSWFDSNPTYVLKRGERINLLQSGTYKIGDGTTQLQNLSFLGSDGGATEWGDIAGDINNQTDLIDYITNNLINISDYYNSITSASNINVLVQSSNNLFRVTALAVNATIVNPSGPIPNDGVRLFLAIKDNGVSRTLNFGTAYSFNSGTLSPASTTPGIYLVLEFVWNAFSNKWDCILNTDAVSSGGGTIIGTIAATAGLIPFATGNLNEVTSSGNIKYDGVSLEVYNLNNGPGIISQISYISTPGNITPSDIALTLKNVDLSGNTDQAIIEFGASLDALSWFGIQRQNGVGGANFIWVNKIGFGGAQTERMRLDYLGNLEAFGNFKYKNQYSTSAMPSIVSGFGYSVSIIGTNDCGEITIVTGISTLPGDIICTITNSGGFAYPNKCICTLQSANNNAASGLLSGEIVVTNNTTDSVLTMESSTALLPSTVYKLAYIRKGY